MEEEKKETPSAEKKTPEEESDFADEAKPVSAPVEAKPVEETKIEQPKVDLYAEKEAEAPAPVVPTKNKGKEAPISYAYEDPDLEAIEASRLSFFKVYKHENLIKWIVTGVILLAILGTWLGVTFSSLKNTTTGTVITLVVVAVAIIALGVYSVFFRKKMDKAMKSYFNEYYSHNNHYVFGENVKDVTGTVDDKLDSVVFNAAGLYKNVAKVGSRDCLHFTYKDKAIVFADAAGQVNGQKSLTTCFVGKFIAVPNANEGAEIIIYLKGNKRALPPTTLENYEVLEDSKTMVVYGPKDGKKILTHAVRQALASIDTDATLVDVAIAVRKGMTYIAMGYEDNLMVLPMDKPFNPAPTMELKKNLQQIFALIDAFDGPEEAQ
jgi:uncharacterized membrane protein (DUF485 family)